MTKRDKDLIKFIIIFTLIIFVPFDMFIWYTQPIDETLTCNQNFVCKVDTTRFFNIKTTKEFHILKQSNLDITYRLRTRGPRSRNLGPTGHTYMLEIDGINVFYYPICSVSEYNYNYNSACKPSINSINLRFEKYKQDIMQVFTVTSEARIKSKFNFNIIVVLLLWFLCIGILFTDSDLYKEYKQRQKHERKYRKNYKKKMKKRTKKHNNK